MIPQSSLTQIYQQIALKSKQIFQSHYSAKFKKKIEPGNFTVISSFTLLQSESAQIQVISVGFGTKSLPYELAKNHQHRVIKDMHAEILARRGLCKFINSHIPQPQQQNGYFEWVQGKRKHRLRGNFKLIFYSSEVFCGDCMVDSGIQKFSGAKPLKFFNLEKLPQQKYTQNCLRTKPGRLDLPLNKRTLSLSCSDKVGLWNILGVQGRRLFNKIVPLYISTAVIEVNSIKEQPQIQKGINLIERIQHLTSLNSEGVHRKIFEIKINGKYRSISKQFVPNIPKLHLIEKQQAVQKSKNKGLEVCGVIAEEVSWLNGKTGLPEGLNINKLFTKISPFCSQALYSSHVSVEQEEFKYVAIKGRIKHLFGHWTDTFKTV